MYVWNTFTIIACCESLFNSILDDVNTTLTQLDVSGGRDRRYFYDDLCLVTFVKGVCLRHKHSVTDALACFDFVVTQ